jgi:hypothetical protein
MHVNSPTCSSPIDLCSHPRSCCVPCVCCVCGGAVRVSMGGSVDGWYVGWLYRACRRFAKGLTVGFAGKSGFALLGLLIKSKFNLRRLLAYPYLPSALAGEPIAYGLFLGSMLAGIQATTDTLAPHLPPSSSSVLTRAALSSSVSCVALYFLPPSHRSSVCLFFAVRALEVTARWLGRRYEAHIPVTLRDHCATIAFCVGSAEICWAALYHTSALEVSPSINLHWPTQCERRVACACVCVSVCLSVSLCCPVALLCCVFSLLIWRSSTRTPVRRFSLNCHWPLWCTANTTNNNRPTPQH